MTKPTEKREYIAFALRNLIEARRLLEEVDNALYESGTIPDHIINGLGRAINETYLVHKDLDYWWQH